MRKGKEVEPSVELRVNISLLSAWVVSCGSKFHFYSSLATPHLNVRTGRNCMTSEAFPGYAFATTPPALVCDAYLKGSVPTHVLTNETLQELLWTHFKPPLLSFIFKGVRRLANETHRYTAVNCVNCYNSACLLTSFYLFVATFSLVCDNLTRRKSTSHLVLANRTSYAELNLLILTDTHARLHRFETPK
ncbi:hypothetical protein BaRGS_00004733 [Batillaria attramentaria]|uniref:Uncharacterized protein n=1 Tax=Batillaria attramentaria TaxID=370345 RepID=A0ABD0LXZ4_9CAEN